MKKIKITSLIIATLFSTSIYADIPIYSGWFAEGSGGLTNTNTSSTTDKTALGFNANAGYKFIPFVGVEGGYSSYGTSSSSFIGYNAIDVAIRGIIPFPEIGGELFAKLGGAQAKGNGESSTGLYYAFGADYWLRPHMAILVQWSQVKGNKDLGHLNLLSGGVQFLI